jgi:hypothetical protein
MPIALSVEALEFDLVTVLFLSLGNFYYILLAPTQLDFQDFVKC